jgi:hypothetical protein
VVVLLVLVLLPKSFSNWWLKGGPLWPAFYFYRGLLCG